MIVKENPGYGHQCKMLDNCRYVIRSINYSAYATICLITGDEIFFIRNHNEHIPIARFRIKLK